MKILIACEYSAIVRTAFERRFTDVWSCDLDDTEKEGNHYKGSVLDILHEGWDMMVAFPPCTYLSNAAAAYWDRPGRAKKRLEALDFFLQLWDAPIPHIAIENPLGIASRVIKNHDQIVEPYYFGDAAKKRTCLWLKNLPQLKHYAKDDLFNTATHVPKPKPIYRDKKTGKARYFTDAISSSKKDQGKKRSRFWPGIANAMAEQWGDYLLSNNVNKTKTKQWDMI